jgi:hypothetical protein
MYSDPFCHVIDCLLFPDICFIFSDGLLNSISNIGKNVKNAVVKDGSFEDLLDKNLGLFLDCKEIAGDQVK